jgi:hypothetical protein
MRLRARSRVTGSRKIEPPLVGDRYISPTGSDSNDGLTRGTAWATVTPLNTWLATLNAGNFRAVVMAGTYTATAGFVFTRNVAELNVTLEFEEGVTYNSSAATSTLASGFDIGNNPLSTLTVNLRGATFLGAPFGSANGIGTNNGLNAVFNGLSSTGQKASFSGYDDGVSFHGTGIGVDTVQVNDCTFSNCTKSAYAHVSASTGRFRRCDFTAVAGASLGVGRDESSGQTRYEDCRFFPATSGQEVGMRNAELIRCQIGSLSVNASLLGASTGSNALSSTLTDCYLNARTRTRSIANSTFTRCYGPLFIETQEQPSVPQPGLLEKCVFSGSVSLAQRLVDGVSPYTVRDCVIFNMSQIGASFNATNDTNFLAAPCLFEFNAIFGTTIRTQIASAVVNTVTADPLVGSRATTNQADWAVAANSPCVGAGKTGGNIGFTLADIGL